MKKCSGMWSRLLWRWSWTRNRDGIAASRAEASNTAPNYCNDSSRKTVKPQLGEVDIKVPRDQNGTFESKLIGKYSRNADGMEEKILALYTCGMSQRDIAEQIKVLYDVEISPELFTAVHRPSGGAGRACCL